MLVLVADRAAEMTKWAVWSMVVALLGVTCSIGWPINNEATLSLLKPQGIRFSVADVTGTQLVAFHYSINVPLYHVKAGQWNVDITSKSADGTWVHENTEIDVKPGDVVYYWVHRIRYNIGSNLLEQEWVAVASDDGANQKDSTTAKTAPTAPTISSETVTTAVEATTQAKKADPTPVPDVQLSGQYRLVFEDRFATPDVDTTKWEHEVSFFGGFNGEFQAYTPEVQNSYVKNKTLHLRPTLTADRFGEAFLSNGVWDMNEMYGRCTNDGNSGCHRDGKDGLLNPIMSAKLSSKTSIKYGRVEIVAKMPKGDWLWPAMWLLPRHNKYGEWPRSGEIDIAETIGNRNYGGLGIQHVGSTLHWGAYASTNRWPMTHQKKTSIGVSYADKFYKYVLDWTKDYIKVLVDDEEIMNVPTPKESFFTWGYQPGVNIWSAGDKNAPFDQDFYLILNVAVGGTNGYIPDNLNNVGGHPKPWRNSDTNSAELFWNAKDEWYPTWQGEEEALQVQSVRMWQLV